VGSVTMEVVLKHTSDIAHVTPLLKNFSVLLKISLALPEFESRGVHSVVLQDENLAG
jgi:hypothetical protein